jgi:hypothetical protein
MVEDTETPGDLGDLEAAKNRAADQIYATIDDTTDEKYINYTE